MTRKKKKLGSAKRAAKRVAKREKRREPLTYGRVSKEAREIKGGFLSFTVIGDSVAGSVQAIERGEGQFGPETKITVECDDGAVVTFRCPTILKNAIEQLGVAVGDYIAAEYVRDVPTTKGNPAKQFLFEHIPGGKAASGGKRKRKGGRSGR